MANPPPPFAALRDFPATSCDFHVTWASPPTSRSRTRRSKDRLNLN